MKFKIDNLVKPRSRFEKKFDAALERIKNNKKSLNLNEIQKIDEISQKYS